MRFSFLSLLLIGLVALTACGGEPENILMDRRFLTAEQLDQQAKELRARASGEVLDAYEWTDGEHRVMTLLSRDRDADGYEGVFLRHYRLGDQGAQLMWTYQDSLACVGAAAGAETVSNSSPELRPGAFSAPNEQEFVLRYHLDCTPLKSSVASRTLVIIDAITGAPRLRLDGEPDKLAALPTDRAQRLQAIWEG